MIELGKTIFFGGIALIVIAVILYFAFGLLAGMAIQITRLCNSSEISVFIKSCIKLFNPVAVFRYLRNTRESGDDYAGCFAVVLLIPFYLIIFIIAFSLVRDFIIPLFN
ncbi:hypothetical protein ACU41F_003143 [Klebsiella aerogenes]